MEEPAPQKTTIPLGRNLPNALEAIEAAAASFFPKKIYCMVPAAAAN